MTNFNQIQEIKRRFFAMRNGIIADTLRKNGSSFKIIFGLNLPQITDIANDLGTNSNLARQFWENKSTRESMILATMLMPVSEFDRSLALQWINEVNDIEIADILVHRLLRKLPYAFDLAILLSESPSDKHRYISMRILWHFLSTHKGECEMIAKAEVERDCSLTKRAAAQIVEELEFL